ncbi:MAG: rRNA maturation RNase YbeY [Candidatus Wildermuthbacteria bacterium]|nr:rRNA maturation RNase YbeY [Candidatus Wildermuthbacteria bacterium]
MIEVNNLTRKGMGIDERLLKKIATVVLKGENRKEMDVSIGIIGKEEIKKLNQKYRKKNRPTDVLSFLYKGSGEIVICPQEVKKNAKKYKLALKEELARVLIHGILHLLGYNHEARGKEEKKMKEREGDYLFHTSFFLKKTKYKDEAAASSPIKF